MLDCSTDLEAKISAAQVQPSLMPELSQELANLSKSLADAHDKLPTYDQRKYGLVRLPS